MAKKQDVLGFQDQQKKGPVECLGMKFENDEARREHFLNILREKLQDPEFRKIEGFPIGEDEDILALSDPPYYTACPNPFVGDFIRHYGKPYDQQTDDYHREPFATDVSEGKNDPIYNAHTYHTKVPHKAIMRYILHYTEPGDIVFDGFCGTGMAGVAAQLCGDKTAVEALGYQVKRDGTVLDEDGKVFSKLGSRRAVLNDLSPAATFIAYNYNMPVDVEDFQREVTGILDEVERECSWMYLTLHEPPREVLVGAIDALQNDPALWSGDPAFKRHWGSVNYTIWSDVFVCPQCSKEVVFWDSAIGQEDGKVLDEFACANCHAMLTKRSMERARATRYDDITRQMVTQAKQVPVLIDYSVGGHEYTKKPDEFDEKLIAAIEQRALPYWVPTTELAAGDKTGEPLRLGCTRVHHFHTRRNLWVLAAYFERAQHSPLGVRLYPILTGGLLGLTRLQRYSPGSTFPNMILSGTLYFGSLMREWTAFRWLRGKLRSYSRALGRKTEPVLLMTQSTTGDIGSPRLLDYVFTDPPFGGNLMYSELNLLWEAWLRVFTNNDQEAVQSAAQEKGLLDYQQLMTRCFREYYQVLKPGRWMTVEFHNSQNRIWNAIQEALQNAGFVVADVRVLDKQQGSFNALNAAGAVKQDLVISAYKPNGGLEDRFELEAGSDEGVWDFVRTHLRQLPVFVQKDGQSEVIAERQDYLLFDRMVAFHVQRGVTIPVSAVEFYAGLRQRFPERDGMFFLPEQVTEYDRKRITVREVLQLQLFVTDESSAIQWLRQQLTKKPQTFQELQPQFMQEVKAWLKHERTLELSEMLAENFVCYEGDGEVPSPIHAYLSSNYHELRTLPKDHPDLIAKARNRWYVPDPNREGDLEKIRLRALMKEFEEYQATKGKLKVLRTEALRAGFKQCWQDGNYTAIVDLAKRLPSAIIEEDPALLMYYDNALLRTEG